MRGRKPKPTHLKVLAGNPGKRPLNRNEPRPEGDLHEPPSWLTETQKESWGYAIEHAPPGLLKCLDRGVLTVWVIAEDQHRHAAEMVARHGVLVKSPVKGEPMQSPYLAIMNRQAQFMLKAAEQLGFSPASRPRISVHVAHAVNPFAAHGVRSI